MKKFKFLPPYKKEGKTTFPATRGRSGVYLIKEAAQLVYIGMSSTNLYRTLYRHFETWNADQEVTSYKKRLTKYKYTVRIVLCSPAQAVRLERALIIKYKPRDNHERYKNYKKTPADVKVVHEFSTQVPLNEMPF